MLLRACMQAGADMAIKAAELEAENQTLREEVRVLGKQVQVRCKLACWSLVV